MKKEKAAKVRRLTAFRNTMYAISKGLFGADAFGVVVHAAVATEITSAMIVVGTAVLVLAFATLLIGLVADEGDVD